MKIKNRSLIVVNIVLLILELVAFVHDCYAFGVGLFVWYTVDSNVLQQPVSVIVLWFGIVAVLCVILSVSYYKIKFRNNVLS